MLLNHFLVLRIFIQYFSSNSTLKASFTASGPITNNITIHGTSKIPWGFALEISSDYPLDSNVDLDIRVRGTWMVSVDNEGNRVREEEFPDIRRTVTLEKNKSSFTIDVRIGNSGGTGGQVESLASANFGVMILTDSDNKYNYQLVVDTSGMIYW